MEVIRLGTGWEAAVEALLVRDPILNLFPLSFLDVHPIDRSTWMGAIDGDAILALTLMIPRRLAVPCGEDLAAMGAIGTFLRRRRYSPSMVVGPREPADALWSNWAPSTRTRCFFDQRMYVCEQVPTSPPLAGFRRALEHEWRVVSEYSGAMEQEDLGRNPALTDPAAHRAVVIERIRSGRTWVLVRDDTIVFQINVGTRSLGGCQVGGTYVPPAHRGKGYATLGMRELCRRLVPKHRCVSLHVNEANTPAVALYERAGFRRAHAMRLITLEDT